MAFLNQSSYFVGVAIIHLMTVLTSFITRAWKLRSGRRCVISLLRVSHNITSSRGEWCVCKGLRVITETNGLPRIRKIEGLLEDELNLYWCSEAVSKALLWSQSYVQTLIKVIGRSELQRHEIFVGNKSY